MGNSVPDAEPAGPMFRTWAKPAEIQPEKPKADEKKPDVLPMGGCIEKVWNGIPFWHCPRCRMDTFDAKQAKVHTCKGPVVKPYKGE